MSNKRCVGDILGLEIQLGDGDSNPSERVFARVEEFDGTLLTAEFEMPRIADGSFTNETELMPDKDQIKVLYFIRRSNGVTASNKYNPNFLSEVFVKDITGQIVKDNLDAKVSSGIRISGSVTSVISDKKIQASIEEKKLTATIEKKKITGVISEC